MSTPSYTKNHSVFWEFLLHFYKPLVHYKDILSVRLENVYRENNYDMYIGDPNKYRTSALPEIVVYNEQFLTHLFNELNDIPNKKRICLSQP